jgi:hypothetical protein
LKAPSVAPEKEAFRSYEPGRPMEKRKPIIKRKVVKK